MVNTRPTVLTPAQIDEWKRKIDPDTKRPYTQAKIAELHGVTPAEISRIKRKTNNYMKTAREAAMEHYPWSTPERFHNAGPNRCVRDHVEYMATGGDGMNQDKLQRLYWFYRRLEGQQQVVEFDPAIPPNEDSTIGGFAYRKRIASDGELIIRVNEHTTLTPEGERLLQMPPERPRFR